VYSVPAAVVLPLLAAGGCLSSSNAPSGEDAQAPTEDATPPSYDAAPSVDAAPPPVDAGQDAFDSTVITPPQDSGTDATVEASTDAPADVAIDTGVDAGFDATLPDAGIDAGEDAGLDAGPDVTPIPDAGIDVIETLATAQAGPWEMTVDSNNLYWTNLNDGKVQQLALDGGALTTLLTTGSFEASGIVVTSSTVYWTNFGTTNNGSVQSMPIGGGDASTLASHENSPYEIALDTNNVYWAVGGGLLDSGTIMAAPLDGGPAYTVYGYGNPFGIVRFGDTIAFTNDTWPGGSIESVLVDGGGFTHVLPNLAYPRAIVQAGGNYYFSQDDDGGSSSTSLWTVSVGGGAPQLLYKGSLVARVAVDATNLYWTENGTGEVLEAPLAADGAAPIVLATGQGAPIGIAVGGGYVYWANNGDGTVRRAPIQ
jgi:hypothetical protein